MIGYRGKRVLDVALTIPALLVLAPLLAIIALLVRIRMGSPVLFRQQRPGLEGRPFTLVKFRTMTDERDEVGDLLPDARRLTRLGRFLRSTSLDELPELVNVLRGDMSLVGPRPLPLRYLPFYTQTERRRHELRPGITGWAQIHGRNELPWSERLALDVWYADNVSLLLEIKILLLTVWAVVSRRGVRTDTQSAMANLDDERAGNVTSTGA